MQLKGTEKVEALLNLLKRVIFEAYFDYKLLI